MKLVIRADRKPAEGHQGQFNAPATNEVAVIMAGDTANPRDIVITINDGQLRSIRDTNKAYDCLQYPLIFWDGRDGYHFEIHLMDLATGQNMAKKCWQCSTTASCSWCAKTMLMCC